jgi:cysteine-rich repeat protein
MHMKKLEKKGIEPIISTVLIILVTIVIGGATAYYTIPLVSNVDISCLDALKAVDFEDAGVTCTLADATNPLSAFSVRISNVEVIGFDLGFKSEGKADTYPIKKGTSYSTVCQLDSQFGKPLDVPNKQEVRTYVTKGTPEQIFISPILKSGKSCYAEGRKEISVKVNCVDPTIKARINNCLSLSGTTCGNGNVDAGEDCDPPASTCTPQYNSQCTYCDTSCHNIVLQGPYCGDLSCQAQEDQTTCPQDCGVPACQLTSAYWNITDAVAGQQVSLIVNGTNCNGQTVNFTILEDDIFGDGFDDSVIVNPINAVFINNQAVSTWNAEWQSDWPANPPEYYFIAHLISNNLAITSSQTQANELKVNPASSTCGNGVIDSSAGETCDDSNTNSGDGCSNMCQIENGYDCSNEPSTCSCTLGDIDNDGINGCLDNCPAVNNPNQADTDFDGIGDVCDSQYCGNLIIEMSAGEECDGSNLNPGGTQCTNYGHSPAYNSGTVFCKTNCKIDFGGCGYCGDGIVNGNEACDGSNFGSHTNQCTNYTHVPPYTGGTVLCTPGCGISFGSCTTGGIGGQQQGGTGDGDGTSGA